MDFERTNSSQVAKGFAHASVNIEIGGSGGVLDQTLLQTIPKHLEVRAANHVTPDVVKIEIHGAGHALKSSLTLLGVDRCN